MKIMQIILCGSVLFFLTPALSPAADQVTQISSLFGQTYGLEGDGKFTEAIECLNKIERLGHKSYFFSLRKGWLLYKSGQYQDSIKSYDQAILLSTDAVEPIVGKIAPLIAMANWVEAEKLAVKALGIDQHNATALSNLAWICFNLKKFQDAEIHYRHYLKLYPSSLEMRSGLGWSLLKLGKNEEARAEFEQVLLYFPIVISARQGLAAIP
jgi:protein O-GlcNAc transferase